jgi:hypothetical protein
VRKLLGVFARNPDARLLAGLFLLLLLLLPAMAFMFERLSVIRPRLAAADPPTAQAVTGEVELTLNCQYDDGERGNFSAIVHMWHPSGRATIETTEPACSVYAGSFTDLEVTGDCALTVKGTEMKAWLNFNRFSGAFGHRIMVNRLFIPDSNGGHCVPAKKKLF